MTATGTATLNLPNGDQIDVDVTAEVSFERNPGDLERAQLTPEDSGRHVESIELV